MADKRYDPSRKCSKCGYVATTEYGSLGMRRACQRCGHVWFEKPLDEAEDG